MKNSHYIFGSKILRNAKKAGLFIITSVLTLGGLSSCYDDLGVNWDKKTTDPTTTLTIYIPNVEGAAEYGATRADNNQNPTALQNASEAKINTLWFFAYPVKKEGQDYIADISRQTVIERLEIKGNTKETTFEYVEYEAGPFQNGGYRIYVLANIEDYLSSSLSSSIEETELKSLVLNFEKENKLNYPVSGNLPMACINTDIKSGRENSTKVNSDGVYTFSGESGVTQEVYADLTFLCAKVRYTILYDNTNGGFASNDISFVGAKISNVIAKTNFIGDGSTTPDGFILTGNLPSPTIYPVLYPSDESGYLKSTTECENDLTIIDKNSSESGVPKDWTNQAQRAWQGTIYVPENYKTDDNRTTLSFTAGGSILNTDADYYQIPLFKDNSPKLERGKMYDVVAKVKGPDAVNFQPTVTVSDWTTQNLSYQLHGPYELIVQTTKVDVTAGSWTEPFWYISDVAPGDLRFESPQVGGEDLYTVKVLRTDTYTGGNSGDFVKTEGETEAERNYQIVVTINKDISYTKLAEIKNLIERNSPEADQYKYFEIVAGNLKKKIEVEDLDLKPYLKVTPTTITINMREYTTAGSNNATVTINYETNVTDNGVKISVADPSQVKEGLPTTGTKAMDISGSTTDRGTTWTLDDFSGDLTLNLSELLNGNSLWKSKSSYTLTFSLTGTTVSVPSVPVTINIIPYTTDYIIHFKDNTKEWAAPHIYVYQCLELPSDCGLKVNGVDVSGKTVGYQDGDDETKDVFAALEYAFSNNISFKGWSGYGGDNEYDVSGTTYSEGFVYIGGKSNNDNSTSKSFAPKKGNTTRYNYSLSLNDQHFNTFTATNTHCSVCSKANEDKLNNSGTRTYPGIAMVYEGDGWWKYTLSGVATPGKAMIMFSDLHNGGNGDLKYRYPGDAEVGVPLFDFPDNEGWFLYDGKSLAPGLTFTDDRPTSKETDQTRNTTFKKYRLYWTSSICNGWYFAVGTGGKYNNIVGWQDGTPFQTEGNWRFIDFELPEGYPSDITYKAWNAGNGNNKTGSLSTFEYDSSKDRFCAYLTEQWGDLRSTPTFYYLYFYDQQGNYGTPYAHIWDNNGHTNGTYGTDGEKMEKINSAPSGISITEGYKGDGNWYQIEIPSNCNGGYFKIYDNNNSSQATTETNDWKNTYNFTYTSLSDNKLDPDQNNKVAFYDNIDRDTGHRYVGWFR